MGTEAHPLLEEVSDIERLTEEQLQCRMSRVHPFRVVDVEESRRPGSIGYRVVFQCQNCPRIRHDVIDWYTGDLLTRDYPDVTGWYKWTGEKLLVGDVRLETLRRLGFKVGKAAPKRARVKPVRTGPTKAAIAKATARGQGRARLKSVS